MSIGWFSSAERSTPTKHNGVTINGVSGPLTPPMSGPDLGVGSMESSTEVGRTTLKSELWESARMKWQASTVNM